MIVYLSQIFDMNKIKTILVSFPLLAALVACGGGGDVAGDVATFSVFPSEVTWTPTTCPALGVSGAVSIHTINGGKPPFRVRSQIPGIDVGLVDASNQFVVPGAGMLNGEGDLVLSGKDPKFAVRSEAPCGSDRGVLVLDYFSNAVSVSIKVEASEEPPIEPAFR